MHLQQSYPPHDVFHNLRCSITNEICENPEIFATFSSFSCLLNLQLCMKTIAHDFFFTFFIFLRSLMSLSLFIGFNILPEDVTRSSTSIISSYKGSVKVIFRSKRLVCFDMLCVADPSIPWWLIKPQEIPFFREVH